MFLVLRMREKITSDFSGVISKQPSTLWTILLKYKISFESLFGQIALGKAFDSKPSSVYQLAAISHEGRLKKNKTKKHCMSLTKVHRELQTQSRSPPSGPAGELQVGAGESK